MRHTTVQTTMGRPETVPVSQNAPLTEVG